jgi:hypothetical protein
MLRIDSIKALAWLARPMSENPTFDLGCRR